MAMAENILFNGETSLVRGNLMTREGYSVYCGANNCRHMWPRTIWNGSQFECRCGWKSNYPDDFIQRYKAKWGK